MCTYPMAFYLGCDGACLNDVDGDGICDELEIPGMHQPSGPQLQPLRHRRQRHMSCHLWLAGAFCRLPATTMQSATFYVPGSCDFECLYGASGSSLCTAPEACNVGEDGPCEFMSCLVLGCTLGSACNFNPDATVHDGSCEFNSCGGCMNPLACDFEPTATIHTGCLDFGSCVGCMDPNASNHDPNATVSGWCSHSGCTLPEACNYDANANVSDGTCEFDTCVGCTVEHACNYDPGATIAGFCDFPLPILIAKGTVCWKIAARFGLGMHRRMCVQLQPLSQHRRRDLRPRFVHGLRVHFQPPTTMRQPLRTTVRACSCSARNCHVWTRWALPISMATARCKSKT